MPVIMQDPTREIAFDLLCAVLERHRSLEEALDAAGAAGGGRDRAAGHRLAAGVLRRLGSLDAVLEPFLQRAPPDAVRIIRDMRVALPALVGHERNEAFSQLQGLGLKPQEKRDDTWLDRLIPGTDTVCATSPPASTLVQRGAKVIVEVARQC